MSPSTIGKLRMGIGLLQGLLLFLLYRTVEAHEWPATDGPVFGTLATIGVIVPLLIIVNLGAMRGRTIVAWALCAAAILVGLVFYDFSRINGTENRWLWMIGAHDVVPSFTLLLFVAIGFFIAQSLVLAGDIERSYIASFPTYFDVAWKLAVQGVFALIFVGLLWAVLGTGQMLFQLIGVSFVRHLIEHDWFAIPITAFAVACAIHITDVRANLVRGIRTVKLILLAWLLPLMVLFVAGFLITLPFKGLDILWKTHHTSQIMLGAAAWLILLTNAVHQDGRPEHAAPKFLRAIAAVAMVLISPLVVIAATAVMARAGQYGWTVNLIDVTASIVVAGCFAAGYLNAALPIPNRDRIFEHTNIYTAFITLGILLALFSPIADPARISANDQMARLESGQTKPETFDYIYLRDYGGKYGMAALVKLRAEASTPEAKAKIDLAMIKPRGYYQPPPKAIAPNAGDISANIAVYPSNRHLPDTFIKQDWSKLTDTRWQYPACLFDKAARCDAFFAANANDPPQEIMLAANTGNGVIYNLVLLKFDGTNWKFVGHLNSAPNCKGSSDQLRSGNFRLTPAAGDDLELNGVKFQIMRETPCPK